MSDDALPLEYPDLNEDGYSTVSEQSSGQVTPDWNEQESATAPLGNDNEASPRADTTLNEQRRVSAHDFPRKSANIKSLPGRQLVVPRSLYDGFVPALPRCSEWRAVADLLEMMHLMGEDELARSSPASDSDFDEIDLTDFSIYLPSSAHYHKWELRSLQYLTLAAHPYFLLDGILSVGGEIRYISQVPFKVCSIGNYGLEHHDVGENIWIQSDLNAQRSVYYKLKAPATEYLRYHEGFMWLANLAKHFVDYCQTVNGPITISNFRDDFSCRLRKWHRHSSTFKSWHDACNGDDFRPAVTRNIHFLFKESIGVDNRLRRLRIWNEILEMDHIKAHPHSETQTIVTD